MRRGNIKLKIYWDDDFTIECRYFFTKEDALQYVKKEGITKYKITQTT